MENSFLCLTYIAETLVVGDGTRLALATYYDTHYVSILFDMRDSGGFPTFHSVLSFSVSLIFADSVSIRDPTVRVSFHDSYHSYCLLLRSIFRYKSILSLPLA